MFCCEFVMLVEICGVIFLQKMYLGKCLCCGCGFLEVKNVVCVVAMDFFWSDRNLLFFNCVCVVTLGPNPTQPTDRNPPN